MQTNLVSLDLLHVCVCACAKVCPCSKLWSALYCCVCVPTRILRKCLCMQYVNACVFVSTPKRAENSTNSVRKAVRNKRMF